MIQSHLIANQKLHPLSVITDWVRQLPQFIIGIPVILAATKSLSLKGVILLALGLGGANLLIAFIRWQRFGYRVTADEIIIGSGVFERNRRIIPLSRVQDVEIEQPFLHQIFGLAKVRLETGSGGKDEGLLDSLALSEAIKLRDALKQVSASASFDDSAKIEEPLFAMPLSRIVGFGALSFSFGSIMAAIASAYATLSQFDDSLGGQKHWFKMAWQFAVQIVESGWLLPAILLFLSISVMFSMGGAVAREYGFQLTQEPRGFRRKRGFLTRSDVLIPVRRIQAGFITSGPVWSLFGWHSLSLQTMGDGDAAGGYQAAAPFAQMEEIGRVLAETRDLALPYKDGFKPVSEVHPILEIIINCVWIIAPLLIISFYWFPILWAIILVPFIAFVTWLGARRHGWQVNNQLVWIQSGFWSRKLLIIPITKIQSLSVTQGLIQRRLNLASLVIDTAGAGNSIFGTIQNIALGDARAFCADLSNKAWIKDNEVIETRAAS